MLLNLLLPLPHFLQPVRTLNCVNIVFLSSKIALYQQKLQMNTTKYIHTYISLPKFESITVNEKSQWKLLHLPQQSIGRINEHRWCKYILTFYIDRLQGTSGSFDRLLLDNIVYIDSTQEALFPKGAVSSLGMLYGSLINAFYHKCIIIITSVVYNRQAQELTERTSSEQAASIREPLAGVNRRWAALVAGVSDRQRRLEGALLRLGQFQHALQELMVWIDRSDATLDSLKPVSGILQLFAVWQK